MRYFLVIAFMVRCMVVVQASASSSSSSSMSQQRESRHANELVALHMAIKEGNVEVLREKVDHNPNLLLVKDEVRRTLLHIAADHDQVGCLSFLLHQAPRLLTMADKYGCTPLRVAAKAGSGKCIEKILALRTSLKFELSAENLLVAAGDAAEQGHKMCVRSLVSLQEVRHILNTPLKSQGGNHLIHKAVLGRSWDCIQELLGACTEGDTQEEVDAKNNEGDTPCHIAASIGDPYILQKLLLHRGSSGRRKVDFRLTEKNNLGEYPIHAAAKGGHRECIALLLRLGSPVDPQSNPFKNSPKGSFSSLSQELSNVGPLYRATPLHYAVYYGHQVAAEELLDSGADPTLEATKCVPGENHSVQGAPLQLALVRGFVVPSLSLPPTVSAKLDDDGVENMRKVIFFRNPSQVEKSRRIVEAFISTLGFADCCLQRGTESAKIQSKPTAEDTPQWKKLHQAVVTGNQQRVTELLTQGVDCFTLTVEGESLASLALRNYDMQVLEAIVGSVTFRRDEGKRTKEISRLLHLAAKLNLSKAFEILFKEHIPLHKVLSEGNWNPLHTAAFHGSVNAVKVLRESALEIDAVTSEGKTAVQLASEQGHCDVLILLLEHGAVPTVILPFGSTIQHIAAREGNADLVQICADLGLAFDQPDAFGWLPLHYAAVSKDLPTLRACERHTLRLDHLTPYGQSLMYLAARSGSYEMLDYLLKKGMSTHGRTALGHTVFHAAAEACSELCVSLCLKHELSPNTKDADGVTPCDILEIHGNQSLKKLVTGKTTLSKKIVPRVLRASSASQPATKLSTAPLIRSRIDYYLLAKILRAHEDLSEHMGILIIEKLVSGMPYYSGDSRDLIFAECIDLAAEYLCEAKKFEFRLLGKNLDLFTTEKKQLKNYFLQALIARNRFWQ